MEFADVTEGDELPGFTVALDRLELVQFAAGSGDFNPLHYDADLPQARAIGDNIVHGRFKYALLGRLVSEWLGHRGWVRSIACEYRGMDLRARPMTVSGRVVVKREVDGAREVDLELEVTDAEGKVTTPGTATVVFGR